MRRVPFRRAKATTEGREMYDSDRKIMTDRGPGRDLAQQPYSVQLNTTYSGPDWFGPLPPLRPIAPPEVAGRVWDYIPGYNLSTSPRAHEPVDFPTLRALADAYDPLRLVIERRKDQMTRLPWTIRARHDGARRRPAAASLSASMRARIDDITAFFRRPDYEWTFRTWLRALLEDLFVIDAPSLYCERAAFGQLTALRVIDGAMVKRIIDDWGRTPRPLRWTGAPFVWNGKEITADNYAALGFVLVDGLAYPPAFQQVLHGMPAVSLTTRDLLYRPFNLRPGRLYGSSPVEQVITTVNIAMRRAFHQLEYYREGNMPEGLFALPASWTPDQVQRFQDYWDTLHANPSQRRKMRFIAGDKGAYVPLKEPPLKNEFDEWLVRIVCFAFSYPVSAFVHQVNRATAEQHEAQAEKEGLEPVKQWAADIFNEIIEREFGESEVEFGWIEEDEIDPKRQSEILTAYADSGALTLNEVRQRIGEEPSPDPAAGVLAVKTATGRVPISTSSSAAQRSEEIKR